MSCYSMTTNAQAIQRRLDTIISRQQSLLAAFSSVIGSGDIARQGQIQKELSRLSAEMQRLTEELRYAEIEERPAGARARSRAPGKTMRELVLDIVDEVGVPLAPATISEFSQITTGVDLPVSRFASLRRDEERAARRDLHSRPAWVAPALSTSRLTAIPRLLTSSAWETGRRLIGARSLRVCHLRTTLAFLHRLERFREVNAPQTPAVESLMLRYARGVPGAVASGQKPAPGSIRKTVLAELEAIEADDLEERRQAAGRLKRYGAQQELWGLPPIIDGSGQSGSMNG
jgi:hypothetical protein